MTGRWILVTVCAAALALCPACGSSETAAEEFEIRIVDGQYETVINVSAGETVENILNEAEILLHENDVVTPETEAQITEDDESIRIERYVNVTVQDREETENLTFTGGQVSDALEAADITLGKHDVVNHSTEAYLTEGMDIVVDRWYGVNLVIRETVVQDESVEVNTNESYIVTQAETVEELLTEQKLSVGEDDLIDQELTQGLADDLTIVISRANKVRITVEEEIAYSTTYENSSSLYEGKTSVKQSGENGVKEYVYEVTYVDGEEAGRELVSETVTKEPVTEIILKGTKKKTTSSSKSSSSSSSKSSSKKVVSKKAVYDCDGSGHGYYIITYSDGSVKYEDF